MHFPRKILIIRLSSIGDIILTTPVYRIVKKFSPYTEIHVITKQTYGELLSWSPYIDKLFLFNPQNNREELKRWRDKIKREKYDFIADLHNNFRSHYLTADYPSKNVSRLKKYKKERFILVHFKKNLYKVIRSVPQRYIDVFRRWELRDDGQGLEIFWPEEVEKKIEKFFPGMMGFIAVAPDAAFATKQWPLERFAEAASLLHRRSGKAIVVIGGEVGEEKKMKLRELLDIPFMDLRGKLSLLESIYLLSKASLLITNDSGPLHMAGSVKTPVVAIFGSTVKELGFFPYQNRYRVLEVKDLSCRPCSHIGRKKCPRRHFRCMTEISTEQVVEAARQLLAKEVRS
jgi:heptosyltransferase-2